MSGKYSSTPSFTAAKVFWTKTLPEADSFRNLFELPALFYAGVAIILAGVFAHPLLSRQAAHKPDPTTLGTAEAKALD